MNIKTISVTYERKINLGDYNSAAVGVTIWADVEPGDDAQAALDQLYATAKENVKKQAMPLLKSNPVSLNYGETFLGVPVDKLDKEKTK